MSIKEQLAARGSSGQITTPAGEEITYFGDDADHVKVQRLTTAFVETDQTARLLKLGQLRQIIAETSQGDVSSSQTKIQSADGKSGVLLNTVVGNSLPDTLLSAKVLENATKKIL
jgi:hypothetical protein